jgi:acetyltransferase
MDRSDLDPFFAPRAVAVVGASSRPEAVGHAVMKNLLFGHAHGADAGDRAEGFEGGVYPVNRKGGEILGQRVYETLSAVPDDVELIVVAIPGRFIPDLLDEAGRASQRWAMKAARCRPTWSSERRSAASASSGPTVWGSSDRRRA